MFKVLLSDFWHVLLFPKDFKMRGNSLSVKKKLFQQGKSVFFDEYFLNEELLSFYSEMKKKHHLTCAIYSSGTLFRAPELQHFLTPIFDKTFNSQEIRFEKNNPASFKYIATQLCVDPSDMLFIDDSPDNISAATEVGVQTVHYHDNEQAMQDIAQLLALHTGRQAIDRDHRS